MQDNLLTQKIARQFIAGKAESLKRNEWNLVLTTALLAFVCGLTGLQQFLAAAGKDASWPDLVYFTLRLFTLSYDLQGEGTPYLPASPLLQVARFLAPATVVYAAAKGFTLAAAYQVNVWRLRRWRGHAVICGAGKRGRQVALALRAEGRKVVVIEKDPDCEAIAELRAAGARIIIGEATNSLHQAQARMQEAGLVVALTSSEESNLEVALEASRRDTGPVDILVHASRQFAGIFEQQQPFDRIRQGVHTRFFDHDAAAARLLLREFATDLATELAQTPRPPRLLLVGDGTLLPELLAAAVAQCQYAFAGVPKLVVATSDRESVCQRFPSLHPQLGQVAEVNLLELTPTEMARLELEKMPGGAGFDLVFVACRNDLETLSLARHLTQQGLGMSGRIVASLRPSTDLMRLLSSKQPVAGVELRDLVELGCRADVLLRGELDREARAIHQVYVKAQTAAGATEATNSALVAWEDLPESLRQANRAQADHIPVKQRALAISRSEQMIESLAEAEHRRWMAEKIVAGWRHAEQRDNARKLHPSLKPYLQLSEAEKQKDRDTVQSVLKEMPPHV